MPRIYRALLVGNANFPKDPHRLPALNGPLVDIRTLGRALVDDDVGMFTPDEVRLLPDHGVQDLRERLDEFFASATREDVLLLYYSGHGQLDLDNRLYLCAHDTRTSGLRSTALKADDINEMVGDCAALSTIIVLDCCHSGAFKGTLLASKGTGAGPVGLTAGRGRYVLASSRSTQLALDTSTTGQLSPFTEQLVRGLREAPSDDDLTVVELYRQVHRWLGEASGPVPQLRFSGEGEVVIARRGHNATRLPPASQQQPTQHRPEVTTPPVSAAMTTAEANGLQTPRQIVAPNQRQLPETGVNSPRSGGNAGSSQVSSPPPAPTGPPQTIVPVSPVPAPVLPVLVNSRSLRPKINTI